MDAFSDYMTVAPYEFFRESRTIRWIERNRLVPFIAADSKRANKEQGIKLVWPRIRSTVDFCEGN